MKNLTDFHKTVETGVDLCLVLYIEMSSTSYLTDARNLGTVILSITHSTSIYCYSKSENGQKKNP